MKVLGLDSDFRIGGRSKRTTSKKGTVASDSKRVATGALWGIVSQAATLVAALLATPFTIRLLGPERYGVYGLLTLSIGNAAFFDLGMGVATTVQAAKCARSGDRDGERSIIWSALAISLPLTIAAATVAFVFGPNLARAFFHLQATPLGDAVLAIRAASVILVVRAAVAVFNTTSLARLNLRFYYFANAVAGVGSVLLAPVLLKMGFGLLSLFLLAGGLAVVSLVLFVYRTIRDLGSLLPLRVQMSVSRSLLAIGIGVIFSFFAEALLNHLDKYLLSAHLSSRDLAHYIVSFNFGLLLVPIPLALSQALFPALSRATSTVESRDLTRQAATVLAEVLLPLALVLSLIAEPFLTLWAGPEYAAAGSRLAHVFLLGQLFAVFAYVPTAHLQALGRTKAIAKLNWAELSLYALVAVAAISRFGLLGGCVVWAIRCVVNTALVTALNEGEIRMALRVGIWRGIRNIRFGLALIVSGVGLSFLGVGSGISLIASLIGLLLLFPIYLTRMKVVLGWASLN